MNSFSNMNEVIRQKFKINFNISSRLQYNMKFGVDIAIAFLDKGYTKL